MVNKQKILIVDDDEAIAELVSLYLAKECFDTMMVHDGEKASVEHLVKMQGRNFVQLIRLQKRQLFLR